MAAAPSNTRARAGILLDEGGRRVPETTLKFERRLSATRAPQSANVARRPRWRMWRLRPVIVLAK